MTREFILLSEFDRQWARLGFDDGDLLRLQDEIKKDPKLGNVIPETGGIRKMRFAFEGKGKSGGSRVLYVDLVVAETIFLLTAYAKGEKENISPAERSAYKQLVEQIKKESGGKNHE
jgi:hypothetical protein